MSVSLGSFVSRLPAILTHYTDDKVLRAGKALLTRGDYEKSMVDSLTMIKTRSSSLMEEAAKSHIHEFHMCTVATSLTKELGH